MAELRNSSVDDAAIREWLQVNRELATALDEVAQDVAARARLHVATHHARYKGLPYRVKTKVVAGRGQDNPLTAVISAPLGAFLGTNTGERHQVRAWGHKTDLWHPAADYVLRDAANESSLWEG